MLRIFISQPMRGKKPEEIEEERLKIVSLVEAERGEEVEVIESYFGASAVNRPPLECLGESLKLLGQADLAVFARGWDDARGCRIEHLVCVEYGIEHQEL